MPRFDEQEAREERLPTYVEQGLRVRLASNIITGQAFLEAVILDPERFPVMEVPWKPRYWYVPSAPSAFRSIQNSVDGILRKMDDIDFGKVANNVNTLLETTNQAVIDVNTAALSTKIQKLTDAVEQAVRDANVKVLSDKIQLLVGDVDNAVTKADIPELSTKAQAFIDELRLSNSDLKKLLENPDSKKELANIAVLVDKFNQVLNNLDDLIVSEKPELREIIGNIRNLSGNLDYLSEHLKDNPSELIFSSPPPKQEK
jgi:hypothetical protein